MDKPVATPALQGLFHRLLIAALLAAMAGGFTGWAAHAQEAGTCQEVAGVWKAVYEGTSCQGTEEEGTLTFVIREDCSFELERESFFPFVDTLLLTGRSFERRDSRFRATVGVRFDGCSDMTITGFVRETPDGRQIIGSYYYDTQGGGRVRGSLKEAD